LAKIKAWRLGFNLRETGCANDFLSILRYAVYVMCHDIILASPFALIMFCSRFLA
jgi:hypothetical protein